MDTCLRFEAETRSSREDGRQGQHLRSQVGQVSQDKYEARLNDLDVFGASGQKRNQQAENHPQEGATERHHEEGHWGKTQTNNILSERNDMNESSNRRLQNESQTKTYYWTPSHL